MKTITLMVSTNPHVAKDMLNGHFNPLVWASDDMETVAHYYEGSVIEFTIKLVEKYHHKYLRNENELSFYKNGYGWGMISVLYPPNANWYSFSKEYLKKYIFEIKEIFPNLTPWQEEED